MPKKRIKRPKMKMTVTGHLTARYWLVYEIPSVMSAMKKKL